MEVVYNHSNKSVNLVENNKEIPLDEVITQCLDYQKLDDVYQIVSLMTTKFMVYVNMVEQLLETNRNVENENDILCKEIGEKESLLQQLD